MRNSKRIKIVAGGTAALFGIGIAYAAWTSTGEGNADVTAGEQSNLTVTQVGTANGLYPTGSENVTVRVRNNNDYPVTLDQLAWDNSVSDNSDSDCDETAAIESVELADGQTLDDYIAPHATADNVFSVKMIADADPGCQNTTFTLGFDASADSTDVASVPAE